MLWMPARSKLIFVGLGVSVVAGSTYIYHTKNIQDAPNKTVLMSSTLAEKNAVVPNKEVTPIIQGG